MRSFEEGSTQTFYGKTRDEKKIQKTINEIIEPHTIRQGYNEFINTLYVWYLM